MTYIDPDIIADETSVAEAILAGIADRIPGWEPAEGSPETAMGESQAVVTATIATLIKDEARDTYSGFGARILNLPRGSAGVASAMTAWTLSANPDGFTIPAGSELVMESPLTGELVAFATVGDRFVAALALVASNVPVTALEPGETPNDAVGAAVEFEDVSSGTASVADVSMTIGASGGSEEEDLDEYVAKVADRARRLRAIPVTTEDFAAFALDIPEVAAAVAINWLDPAAPPAPGVEPNSLGHVTVIARDASGNAISGAATAALAASYTTEDRPLAVQVHLADPETTDVAFFVRVRLEPGANVAEVVPNVQAALTAYGSKATWLIDKSLPWRWRKPATIDRPIREYDLSTVAAAVPGVAGVLEATINGVEEVDLPGWAGLPNLTGVVVEVAA